jgi:catalase
LSRLGGPNFEQLPVNRPLARVRNNQRDGLHQTRIEPGPTSYHKASLGFGCPVLADTEDGAYTHYQERVDGRKIRVRSGSFADHYSQATLFWNSMSDWERAHIVAAFRFELGKVVTTAVREHVVDHLNHVDHALARSVAEGIGVDPPPDPVGENHGRTSPALSQANTAKNGTAGIATRQVAILAGDGVHGPDIEAIEGRLTSAGAVVHILAERPGRLATGGGAAVSATHALATRRSVFYDAVFVPGGDGIADLADDGAARLFVAEAFKHGKAIAALGQGTRLLGELPGVALADADSGVVSDVGVVTGVDADDLADAFIDAIAAHRHHGRTVASIAA